MRRIALVGDIGSGKTFCIVIKFNPTFSVISFLIPIKITLVLK